MGRDVRLEYVDPKFWGGRYLKDDVADLSEAFPHYAACVRAAEKGVMPERMRKTVMGFAKFQMKRPDS